MKVGIIGRGIWTLESAKLLVKEGYDIPLIITSNAPSEYQVKESHFRAFAEELGAKYLCTTKISSSEVISLIDEVGELDICVSVNYSGVIPDSVISKFKIGILNAHGGDLPRYRGNACQAWAILNKEEYVGLCIHKMIGGELDSGDIIDKKFFQLSIDTRIKEVYDWFDDVIPGMFLDSIKKLSMDPTYILERQSKNSVDALRCYPRLPEDGNIEWSLAADDVVRLINVSSEPYCGAFTSLDDEKVIIWRAKVYNDDEFFLGVPGQIAAINKLNGSIIVLCGVGKIEIFEIEINGQRCEPTERISSVRKRFKQ